MQLGAIYVSINVSEFQAEQGVCKLLTSVFVLTLLISVLFSRYGGVHFCRYTRKYIYLVQRFHPLLLILLRSNLQIETLLTPQKHLHCLVLLNPTFELVSMVWFS